MKKHIKILIILILLFSCKIVLSQTWVDLVVSPPPAGHMLSVSTIGINSAWVGGGNGTVIFSSDGGATWRSRSNAAIGTKTVHVIVGLDSVTALCAAQQTGFTYIYKTIDSGLVWNTAFVQQNGFIEDIKMINQTTSYAFGDPVGGRWTLLRTTDGGNSWDSSGLRLIDPFGAFGLENSMSVYNNVVGPTSIWFGTSSGIVYYSSNSGLNWISEPVPGNGHIFTTAFNSPNTGFCSSNTLIYKTTNAGTSWLPMANYPGSGPTNTFAYNSGNFWYGRGNLICYSTDAGANFSIQHTASGNYKHMSFYFQLTDNIESIIGGYAVTDGLIISKYLDPGIGIQQISTSVPSGFVLHQNYPNPFNPSTKIRFDVAKSSLVKIVVYDALGSEVATLVNNQLTPGTYETDFDATKYSSGIYFYKLIVNDPSTNTMQNFVDTKKMIVIK
jgi:Secretion system C-terminal sorting domain/Photosynthesis system II assembly factor YCF48